MDRDSLSKQYVKRSGLLKQTALNLEMKVHDDLTEVGHVDRISFRAKGLDSFLQKVLERKVDPPYENPLTEVEDQLAGRILVFFLSDMDLVRARLEQVFTFVESARREPQKDAEFGYESHHVVCVIPPEVKPNGWSDEADMPNTFELQIRTLCMHAWAEPQHDVGYKSTEDLTKEDRRELAWVAASIWGADHALERVWKRRRTPG
ncbi:MAG: hypothetical protein JNL18_18030 [Planctomycetaceae bacterium]|nr:hypothetical protein [Planctomycetaceae bacterium]